MKVYAYNDLSSLLESPFLNSYKDILLEMYDGASVSPEMVFNNMPGTTIFMIEESNEIIASCIVSGLDDCWRDRLHLITASPDTTFVTSVYTKKAHRKKGCAKKMMIELLKYFPNSLLETYSDWIPATTLYLSIGFKPTDARKDEKGHRILFRYGSAEAWYNV